MLDTGQVHMQMGMRRKTSLLDDGVAYTLVSIKNGVRIGGYESQRSSRQTTSDLYLDFGIQ